MIALSAVLASPAAGNDEILARHLDAEIDRALVEKRIIGAVVLVARDGRLVFRRAAGHADREAGESMREDAVFRLASVTKPIVSAAAMRLVETGALGLDDPVTRWLPEFRPRLADGTEPVITVRQLLTHTAGLSYRFLEPPESAYHALAVSDGLDQPGLGLDDNLARLVQAPLAYAPGTSWRYSLATDVLGAVLERAAGTDLRQLVRDLVTGPLGMADTGFFATATARLVVPYADGTPEPTRMTDGIGVPLGGGVVRFAPSRALNPRSYPSAGAGMVGTVDDVLTLLEAIRRGGAPVLQPETVARMMADQVGAPVQAQRPGWGFGYGWAVLTDPAAAGTPQAKGTIQWGGVYGHSWFVDPENRLTVVALTNTAMEGMAGAFPLQVRNAVYRWLAEAAPG